MAPSAACRRPPLSPGAERGSGSDSRDPANAEPFEAVAPCALESDYVVGAATVRFGFLGSTQGFAYDPRCLKVDTGATVSFDGDFSFHPLYPSRNRGTIEGNPIGAPSSGTGHHIQFSRAGYFAYYCGVHGASDDGLAMAGVVWVSDP